MKCSHCKKPISFFLAYKIKGKSGRYCSTECAESHFPFFDVQTYRGGFLELICFCIWFPYWIIKTIIKILLLPFRLFGKKMNGEKV